MVPAFVYRRYHRHERSGPQAVADVHRDRGRYLRRTLGAGRSAGRADVDGQLSEAGRPGDVLPGGQCQRRRRGHAGRSQPEAIQEADRGLYPRIPPVTETAGDRKDHRAQAGGVDGNVKHRKEEQVTVSHKALILNHISMKSLTISLFYIIFVP